MQEKMMNYSGVTALPSTGTGTSLMAGASGIGAVMHESPILSGFFFVIMALLVIHMIKLEIGAYRLKKAGRL